MIYFANPGERYKKNNIAETKIIKNILLSNKYILGKNLVLFEKNFSKYIGSKYAVGVANATDGIELIMNAHNIKRNDEVITVSHTATGTISAILSSGAKPVLNDINENYLFDCSNFMKLVTKKTKAVIIVHIYGQACDFRSIINYCKKKKILIIEDVSQAHGSKIGSIKAGNVGDYGVFSLYPTKNLGGLGDGGIITMKSVSNFKKINMLRNYGWNSKNLTELNGRNSRLDELQAGILNFRLKNLDNDNLKRIQIAKTYNKEFLDLPIKLPQIGKNLSNVFHLYVIQTKKRDKLLEYLKKNGIIAGIHYRTPNHLHKAIKDKIRFNSLNITTKISKKIISLPIYPELTKSDQFKVIKTVKKFFK